MLELDLMSGEKNKVIVNDSENESLTDEILKYKNLLDMGAITQDEYDAKKKQLLGL